MDKRSVSLKKIFLVDGIRFFYLLIILAAAGAFLGYHSTAKYNQSVEEKIAEDEAQKAKEAEEAEAAAQDVTETTVYTKADCEKKLKGSALQDVLDAYNWYKDKENRQAYLNNSPYLSMNPYDFTSVYLAFRVTHGDLARDDSAYKSYIHALKLYVTYNDLDEELVEKKNLSVTARDLSEMISISDGGKDSYDDFLLITIYQSEITKDLTEDVKSLFLAYGAKLSEIYPGIGMEFEGLSKANYYNSGLNTNIESQRNAIISDQTKIDNAVKKFSEVQKVYYNMLVKGTEEESVTAVVKKGTTAKETVTEEEELPTKKSVMPMVVLGGVAGLLIGYILLFFANLLSGRLLFIRDFRGVYGLRHLGGYVERKKAGIPGTLQRMEYPEAEDKEEMAYLYLTVREAVKKEGLNEVYLIGTGKLDDLEGLSILSKKLEKDGIAVSLAGEFPKNSDDVSNLLKAKGVILVEELHKARLKKIDREVSFCKENAIPLLGAVSVVI